jgi:hypothetical protein
MIAIDEKRQLTWINDSLKINKLRINETYKGIEFCNNRQIINITRNYIEKAKTSLKSAKHALSLSPSAGDKDRLDKLHPIIEGLSQSVSSPEGRKMVHEYVLLSKNLLVEILDIACNAYDRAISG